jgi:small subunit ribosomal protein S17
MTGIVTSNKMQKALVVTVYTTKLHKKYKKSYKTKKKYHVACFDSSKFKIGDSVEIVACRPISKTISFKVIED